MKLTRPLVFFDVEATGTDVVKDRIVSLALIQVLPSGETWPYNWLMNPGIPMSEEVIAVHGITNERVADCPPFKAFAAEIEKRMRGCDLAGFNLSNYDVPILWEEFYRAGITWDLTGVNIVDVGTIFKRKEERTLSAAVKFYCGREHAGAHDALEDTKATADVLSGQLQRYPDLAEMDVPALAKFSDLDDRVDLAGKIVRDKDGDPCYNFGKVRFDRNRKVGLKVRDDPGLAEWALGKDFPTQTCMVLHKLLREIYNAVEHEGEEEPSLFPDGR